MSKLDDLKRMMGGNVAESASLGPAPAAAAPAWSAAKPARMEGVARSKAAMEIPLEKIGRDEAQPREEFDPDALGRLADSIRARGLLQPIRVRWVEAQGRYVLISGERRWRASRMAGLSTITAIVAEGQLTPAELLADQVTENLLREDLTPIERAKAYRTLMGLNGWSGNQLAKELGVAQSQVVLALSLLDLPEAVQEKVDSGELAASVGYELTKLPDPEERAAVAERVVAENLTRADVAEVVRRSAGRRAAGKGRGGRAKVVTSKTLRASNGYRATFEHRRGIDPEGLVAALGEMLDQARALLTRDDQAAA